MWRLRWKIGGLTTGTPPGIALNDHTDEPGAAVCEGPVELRSNTIEPEDFGMAPRRGTIVQGRRALRGANPLRPLPIWLGRFHVFGSAPSRTAQSRDQPEGRGGNIGLDVCDPEHSSITSAMERRVLSAREAVQRVRPTVPASGRPVTCPCSRALATPDLILFIIARRRLRARRREPGQRGGGTEHPPGERSK
jgi:hypothetical protein